VIFIAVPLLLPLSQHYRVRPIRRTANARAVPPKRGWPKRPFRMAMKPKRGRKWSARGRAYRSGSP